MATPLRDLFTRAQLEQAVGGDYKGKLSLVLYVVAIPAAVLEPLVAYGIYVGVALIWFIPDSRIERAVAAREADGAAQGGD